MLENLKKGDLCIFSNGDQARVINKSEGRIWFDKLVTGWIGDSKSNSWAYYMNGVFVHSNDNRPYVNIIKVLSDG